MKRVKTGFESPTQRFESLDLDLWRTSQSDLNLQVMDSNLLFKMKLKVEGQTKGFKSLSYGFESLLGLKFKFYKGDSNLLHNNLNPWIWSYEEQVKAIRIFELWIRISYPKWSWRLKVRLKDSNLRVMDSNPSLAQNLNFTKAIRIPYTAIRIPFFVKELNERPVTPTTKFSNPISLTTAS